MEFESLHLHITIGQSLACMGFIHRLQLRYVSSTAWLSQVAGHCWQKPLSMNVKSSTIGTVHFVETDEEKHYQYTRYSAGYWTQAIGTGEVKVSFKECLQLEKAFQEHAKNN